MALQRFTQNPTVYRKSKDCLKSPRGEQVSATVISLVIQSYFTYKSLSSNQSPRGEQAASVSNRSRSEKYFNQIACVGLQSRKKTDNFGASLPIYARAWKKYWPGKICLNLTVSKRSPRVRYTPGLRTHSATQRPPSARLLPFLKSDRTSPGVVRSDLKF